MRGSRWIIGRGGRRVQYGAGIAQRATGAGPRRTSIRSLLEVRDRERKNSLLSKSFSLLCRETFPVRCHREFRRNCRFHNQFGQQIVLKLRRFAEFPCIFPC